MRAAKLTTSMFFLAIMGIYLIQCVWFWHYVNDDAYITFRFSQFLAEGRGPYFNAGEHVEGYTNFLLMLMTALAIKVGGAGVAPAFAKSIGALCGAGTLALVFHITKTVLTDRRFSEHQVSVASLTAMGMCAAHPAFALNGTSGLETLLFTFLLTTGVALGIQESVSRRFLASSAAFGLCLLTRPEVLYLYPVFWLTQVLAFSFNGQGASTGNSLVKSLHRFRVPLMNGCIMALILIAQVAFRMSVYEGEWLPNTYYAKGGGYWKSKAVGYIIGAYGTGVFGLAGAALFVTGLAIARPPLMKSIIPFVMAGAGIAIPFISGIDWMLGWRLLIPYLPFVSMVIALGWLGWFVLLEKHTSGNTKYTWLLLLTIPLQLLAHGPVRGELLDETRIRAAGYDHGHRALASWLGEQTASEDAIAIMDIGIISYALIDHPIVDITGLTDRFIAKSEGGFLTKNYEFDYILSRDPEIIVLTVTAYGDYTQPPGPNTKFDFWTQLESKIYFDPKFQEVYHRDYGEAALPTDWLEEVAMNLGAERVFLHDHPGKYYLLAAFRKQGENADRE